MEINFEEVLAIEDRLTQPVRAACHDVKGNFQHLVLIDFDGEEKPFLVDDYGEEASGEFKLVNV